MHGEPEQIRGVAKGGVANQKAKVEKKKQGEKKMAMLKKRGAHSNTKPLRSTKQDVACTVAKSH